MGRISPASSSLFPRASSRLLSRRRRRNRAHRRCNHRRNLHRSEPETRWRSHRYHPNRCPPCDLLLRHSRYRDDPGPGSRNLFRQHRKIRTARRRHDRNQKPEERSSSSAPRLRADSTTFAHQPAAPARAFRACRSARNYGCADFAARERLGVLSFLSRLKLASIRCYTRSYSGECWIPIPLAPPVLPATDLE